MTNENVKAYLPNVDQADFEAALSRGDYDWIVDRIDPSVRSDLPEADFRDAARLAAISVRFLPLLRDSEETIFGGSVVAFGSALKVALGEEGATIFVAGLLDYLSRVGEVLATNDEAIA